jgi:TolB-like protein
MSERDAAELLARITYSVMSGLPNWRIVSDNEVREVSQTISAAGEAARLRQLGEMVYADAVIVCRVRRFRERVGDEWGAKSPASVAFVLELVDVRRGDVVWSASFDETQKSLSENIFAIGEISARGVRWLTAEQLAQEGVKKAVAQLHQLIARTSTS